MTEFEQADIIKAPSCPHYMPRPAYDALCLVVGPGAEGTIRCERCYEQPVRRYGAFEQSGPRPKPRVTVAKSTWLERQAA